MAGARHRFGGDSEASRGCLRLKALKLVLIYYPEAHPWRFKEAQRAPGYALLGARGAKLYEFGREDRPLPRCC